MRVQRLRFRYRLTAEAAAMGHREIVYAWDGAAKAAGLSLAYSEGKRPTAQISLAAPLPRGATSDAEIADIALDERVDPHAALRAIAPHLPPGIVATDVREVGVNAPAVQASLRWAEWEVTVPAGATGEEDLQNHVASLLAATTLPSEYKREKGTREYDLRPLVLDVALASRVDDSYVLCMRLRAEQDRTARADQVVLALGLEPPTRIHRTRLEVDDTSAAVREYRRLREPKTN
ncbi:MAG: TIGR03936 family radical SAM-associated protein [Chloroflexota bacterium]